MTKQAISQRGLSESYGTFINNEFRPIGRATFPAVETATGAKLADIARGGGKEIDAAVQTAERAFPPGRRCKRRSAPRTN